MNPLPDSAADSPLATLRQLKELLDAGALTLPEYEALKQRLLFAAGPAAPDAAAAPSEAAAPPTPYLDTPGALTPEATPLLTPEPDWLAAPAPSLLTPTSAVTASDDDASDETEPTYAPERRNPLNLVFAIGGLLLFLGVVAYLTLGRPTTPDEHLTSTSKTAADSVSLAPEVGPQAEQLTLPPRTGPDTVRVAPAVPLAVPTAAPDSAAEPAASAAPAATAPAVTVPAPKAAAPKPVTQPAPATTPAPSTTPVPADSAASKP